MKANIFIKWLYKPKARYDVERHLADNNIQYIDVPRYKVQEQVLIDYILLYKSIKYEEKCTNIKRFNFY